MKPVQNEFARCYYSDEWHSFLHPFLRSLLSLLAHALWDLACSRSPQFLEAHVSLAQVYYRLKRKADGDRERAVVQKLKAQQDAKQSKGDLQ